MKRYKALGMATILLICLCACNSGGETSSTVLGANISTISNSAESNTTTTTIFADVESSTDTTTQTTTINRTTRKSQTTETDSIYTRTTGTAGALRTTRPTTKVYFDPLKPEIRFFQDSFSVSELGRIVDLVESGSGWFCITEDGSLYELSKGLFSTTKKHYRKVEIPCKVKRYLGTFELKERTFYLVLSQGGKFCAIDTEAQIDILDAFEKFEEYDEYKEYLLNFFSLSLEDASYLSSLIEKTYSSRFYGEISERAYIDGKANQLLLCVGETQTVLYSFPKGEVIEYVSGFGSYRTSSGKNILYRATVRTNKGWYSFGQEEIVKESGYVDVPATIIVNSYVKAVQLEPSVSYYCISPRRLVMEDGTLYYNCNSYIVE